MSRLLLAACLLASATPQAGAQTALEQAVAEARRLVSAGMARAAIERLEPLAAGAAEAQVVAEIAAIRFGSRDYAGAADAYGRLVALAPGNRAALRNLAVALYRAQRPAEAREMIEGLDAETVTSDARLLAVRGLLTAEGGDLETAVVDLEAAADLDAGETFACYELGLLHLAHGQPGKASAALREAARRNPASSSAHYNLGQALIRAGDAEAGRAALATAAEIARRANEDQSRRGRGVALAVRAQEALARGDAEAAVRDLDRATEIFPDDPQLAALREQARLALAEAPPP